MQINEVQIINNSFKFSMNNQTQYDQWPLKKHCIRWFILIGKSCDEHGF